MSYFHLFFFVQKDLAESTLRSWLHTSAPLRTHLRHLSRKDGPFFWGVVGFILSTKTNDEGDKNLKSRVELVNEGRECELGGRKQFEKTRSTLTL